MQLEARHDARLPSIGRKSIRNMRFSVRALLWLILFFSNCAGFWYLRHKTY